MTSQSHVPVRDQWPGGNALLYTLQASAGPASECFGIFWQEQILPRAPGLQLSAGNVA